MLQLIVVCVSLGFVFRALMDFLTIIEHCLDGIGPVFISAAHECQSASFILYSIF